MKKTSGWWVDEGVITASYYRSGLAEKTGFNHKLRGGRVQYSMVEPITAQQAYPFPKRAGGHPNFVALLERLYAEHAAKRKADIDAGRPDPGGLTVISWDTNHTSPIIKEALANPGAAGRTAMSVLAAHRAVYVDEGGSFVELLARLSSDFRSTGSESVTGGEEQDVPRAARRGGTVGKTGQSP